MNELDRACALVQVLLDEAELGRAPVDPAHAKRRRRTARAMLARSNVPTAVFADADPQANRTWHAMFDGTDVSAALAPYLAGVQRTSARVRVPELEFRAGTRVGYLAAVLEPRRGLAGAFAGVIAVCADRTDLVTARRLGVPPEAPVWTGAVPGVADHVNAAWLAYTGMAAGASWLDSVHADDRERCMHALRTAIEVEVRLRRADGAFRWHRVRFVSDGPELRWYGSALDIHDARELAQANRLKDQFLAAVSHELRAPLTTMLLWEKVLRDATADGELRRQALDAIHNSAIVQSRLVGDLLDVARAISGKLYVDLRPVDVTRVLEEALGAIAPAMAAKQIALAHELDPGRGLVQGDAVRLRQVFDNLLSNALEFTEAGGRVEVSTRRARGAIEIVISDTGRGIAKELLPRLFQPFSQTDEPRTHGGLGLGLAISHQLVMLHHGTLRAESPGRGRGATFTVTLPRASAML